MEEDNPKKGPIDLDWEAVLDKDDGEPPALVIVKTNMEPPKPSLTSTDQSLRDDYVSLTDRDLEEAIKRQRGNLDKYGKALPDNGEKLRAAVKALEEECERRKLRRPVMDVDECDKPTHSTGSGANGSSNGFRQESTSSQVHSKSRFASSFTRKMEENTDCRVVNPFDKELTTLGHCNRQKMRSNGGLSQKRRQKAHSSARQWPFQCASNLSINGGKRGPSNGHKKGRASSTRLFCNNGESLSSGFFRKKDASQVVPLNGSRPRKGQMVVFLDEDEPQPVETMEQANELSECMKDAKIYYPSRDDPQAVEICYKDVDCLAPQAFLTSPIMNFYIRYLWLQPSPTNKAICGYHFFNTFFYKKLEQAVAYTGSDKKSFFVKFRRWWKGVNIFQKAYVFIPIHDDLHWSLVIICIPDKEDESGPIILHLDSLGFHCSSSVFSNIRRYLKEEWDYMNQEAVPSDLPFSDRIWKMLPCRIDEKIIAVPQQKNDYDCGLFVLFFMERFMEEAPERLKKKDLEMFDKQWFRPEEASDLREKIRNLLMDEFQNACENNCILESSRLSSSDGSP